MTKFINGDTFIMLMRQYRTCWLRGAYGTGKTALSCIIAAELYRQELIDNVISNIPIAGAIPPVAPLFRSAIIIDESHLFMDDWKAAKRYLTFVRKADLYILMPSVFPVNVRIRLFSVQRVFNGFLFGLPLWVFEWRLNDGASSEKGKFAVWRPNDVFGVYDTNAIPLDDGGIVDALEETYGITQFEQRRKRDQQKQFNARRALGDGGGGSSYDQSSDHAEYSVGVSRFYDDERRQRDARARRGR